MSSYIKSYKILNFQSWDDSSAEIPLETDMINIIEGANETGKSVLYKVLYNFCFPGYWSPRELIRRGCSTGVLVLQLTDGATILYALKQNSYTYILVEPDGTQTEWTNQGCPDEIIARLGLILDKETQVILNVIDSDVALPFIKTSPKFNASLIRAIVEPEGMTKFFQNLADTTQRVENAKYLLSSKASTLHDQIVHIPIIDPIDMEQAKYEVDSCISLANVVNTLESSVSSLFSELQRVITVVEDPQPLKTLIDLVDKLQNTIESGTKYTSVLEQDIQEVKSPTRLDDSINLLTILTNSLDYCSVLLDVINSTPEVVNQPNKDTELALLRDILLCKKNAIVVHNEILSAPVKVLYPSMDTQFSIYELLTKAEQDAIHLAEAFHSLEASQKATDDLQADMQKIADEIGVCPMCGQLLRSS